MAGFSTKQIRNVVLLSHGGAGKTALTEAMLFATEAITRMGKVEDGNTVSDFEPEEAKRQTSIQTSIVPCVWKDTKINVIDTPGYADFRGEVVSGLRVADSSVVVVSASAGPEVGTEQVWQMAEQRGLSRIIFLNKMDQDNADFTRTMAAITEAFGRKCVPIQIPSADGSIVDLLHPGDGGPGVDEARERMMETIAETNDDLTNKFLESGELSDQELIEGLKAGVVTGDLVPVLLGAATSGSGVQELMDTIVDLLPSPADALPSFATEQASDSAVTLDSDSQGFLAALVFKTSADPYTGKLSYFRVYNGTFRSDSQVWNASKGQAERIGQVFMPRGKAQESQGELSAGDIGVVTKLVATSTGDTLCQRDHAVVMIGLEFPRPNYTMAVYPKTKADVDKLTASLARLAEEDPSLNIDRHSMTGETLVAGLGDVHLEVAMERVKRKLGIDLQLESPKVAYRETIGMTTKVEYKHKKQTGGHGQYGHVFLALEPLPRGTGFEFSEKVVGGSVPREYISSVEKGVVKALDEGVLAGFPIIDTKVILYDGSYHPVDSSGICFEIAGSHAFTKGMKQASPIILEPIMLVSVTVPDSYTGDIIGDFNSKRGRILGTVPQERGMTLIEADVPQGEVLKYATELRSMTQGRGTYTTEFVRYEELPQHVTQKVVEQFNKEKEGDRA